MRFTVGSSGNASAEVNFLPGLDGFSVQTMSGGHGKFSIESGSGTLSDAALLETVVLTALDWTFFIGVHAACVMRQGRSVLLCGDSHAGKSTLAYACVRSGWKFVSDNSLHWAAAPDDILVSGSASLRLREGSQALFASETRVVTPLDSSPTAPTGPFVFLQRRPGPAVLQPRSLDLAMQYLAVYDTRPDRTYAEERYRSLLRDGAWTLEYESVWDAVRCLEALL
ncbi:MAG: hypothetical protein ABIR70_21310 [Bryobacteraceae bacterium]